MSHKIYHTRGIILGSVQTGEANRYFRIFTEDLGLVNATAQSVREERSKLRYVLQDFSLVTIDLVQGKDFWRIVSAGEWCDSSLIKVNSFYLHVFARYCALLTRLLRGEGREPLVFSDIVGAFKFIKDGGIKKESLNDFGALVTLRTLVYLGYINRAGYEAFLEPGVWTKDIIEKFSVVRPSVISKIREALASSHL